LKVLRKPKIKDLIRFDVKTSKDCLLIGTDEAGRGPLAGPVCASAVYFPEFSKEIIQALQYLDDSKKFSSNHSLRKEISEEIKKYSLYSISFCSVKEIEKLNILQASLLAMKKAVKDILPQISDEKPKLVLIDGRQTIPKFNINQSALVKGDAISASIAAASILAKVARDDLMMDLSEKFPQYLWHKNKGYGTKEHVRAICESGICEHHRKSFLKKFDLEGTGKFRFFGKIEFFKPDP